MRLGMSNGGTRGKQISSHALKNFWINDRILLHLPVEDRRPRLSSSQRTSARLDAARPTGEAPVLHWKSPLSLSCLTPHASRLMPHASCLTPHASRLTPHASCLTPHTSCLMPRNSIIPGLE